MKQHFTLVLLFLGGLFISSSCTQRVYLNVSEPPAVHLNKEYRSGGVINRSYAAGTSEVLDKIDQALTLEGNLDVKGSTAAVQGAFDELTAFNRFERIVLLDSMTVENRVSDAFPAPLPWAEVTQICEREGLDFLIVLEVYDTDTRLNYSTGTTTKNTPFGSVKVPVHNAAMTTNVNTGWRIYDPNTKLILDEFFTGDVYVARSSGINPVAAAGLLNRGQYVKTLSQQIGVFYAGRVQPQIFRVWRNYFNKGSRDLRIANRRAEVGDWDGAAEMWKKGLDSPKRKVAGRSYYNMAIYKEISGDVYGALEMAQRAYSDYRIKEAQIYANILRNRIQRREREQQLQQNGASE